MRLVEWQDEGGYKHLSLVRDGDPDEMAPHGISRDPPDVGELDWQQVRKDLHNLLIDLRLSDWRDVQMSKDGITSAVLGALRRPLSRLYRMKHPGQVRKQSAVL